MSKTIYYLGLGTILLLVIPFLIYTLKGFKSLRSKSSINTGWLGILGVVLVCILSRLPQLLSPYFHADYNGDECVLGLMAKHIAEGREFPFYFWGQSYGFCWVEAGLVAIAIKLFGVSLFALKMPMLILWTFGCVFFYAAMAQWTHRIYGFWITCLLIFSPAWMGWSMRARAGYITAFLLSTIVLFVLAQSGGQSLKKRATWIGILLGFIFFAQPIYLLGLLPLLFYLLFKQKDFKGFFISSISVLACSILLQISSCFLCIVSTI